MPLIRPLIAEDASSGATAYPFVIGATGNYPATIAGFQNAINDAFDELGNDAEVFVQSPGFIDTGETPTPIAVPGSIKFIGSKNEKPAQPFFYSAGNYDANTNTGDASTLLGVEFDFQDPNGDYQFVNIALTSPQNGNDFYLQLFNGSCTTRYRFNGAWVVGNNDKLIKFKDAHTTGTTQFFIEVKNSMVWSNNGGCLDIQTTGGDVYGNILVDDNSVYGSQQTSYAQGDNVTISRTVTGGSYIADALDLGNIGTNSVVVDIVKNCNVLMYTSPFVRGQAEFEGYNLEQGAVNYIATNNYSGGAVFEDLDSITLSPAYVGIPYDGALINLTNCVWGTLSTDINPHYFVSQPDGLYWMDEKLTT